MGGVFFFFQAEDGIRDLTVTGVQTCALPILVRLQQTDLGYSVDSVLTFEVILAGERYNTAEAQDRFFDAMFARIARSEERRVGKECRFRGPPSRREEANSPRGRLLVCRGRYG